MVLMNWDEPALIKFLIDGLLPKSQVHFAAEKRLLVPNLPEPRRRRRLDVARGLQIRTAAAIHHLLSHSSVG
jgi:hypothetical protein